MQDERGRHKLRGAGGRGGKEGRGGFGGVLSAVDGGVSSGADSWEQAHLGNLRKDPERRLEGPKMG